MAKIYPTEAAARLFGVPLMLDAAKGAVIAQAYGPRLLKASNVEVVVDDTRAEMHADAAAPHAQGELVFK